MGNTVPAIRRAGLPPALALRLLIRVGQRVLKMPTENATVAIYETSEKAETALRQLRLAGLEVDLVSLAGRHDESHEIEACYFKSGGGVRYWGKDRFFWNSVWDALPGWAVLKLPGIGTVMLAGRLAGWVVSSLENAAIFSGLSALGAALYSIGIPRDAVAQFEAELAAGKYLVIAHGPAGEVALAKRVLRADGMGNRGKLSG